MTTRTDPVAALWTEKYRPTELGQMALSEENRRMVESWLEQGEIPHLLMIGPPGCGKTTLAMIMIDALDCVELRLNASSERGIDTIRDKIGTVVRGRTRARWNIVFLDEADQLTRDAQTALRNMFESYADNARFIMTGNHGHRIIDALQSRCQTLALAEMDVKARYKVLAKVLEGEGVQADPKVALGYAQRLKDLRRMLMAAQRSYLQHGELKPVSEVVLSGEDLWKLVERGDYSTVRKVSQQPAFDHRQALQDMFFAVPDEHGRGATVRAVLAKAVHEGGFTPDPVVLFLGAVSECMQELEA